MLTFKQYLVEKNIKSEYLYHIFGADNIVALERTKALLPAHAHKSGQKYTEEPIWELEKDYDDEEDVPTYAEHSKGRIHMTRDPDEWIRQIFRQDSTGVILFRMSNREANRYNWSRRAHGNSRFTEVDVFTTKKIPLSRLEAFNFVDEKWEKASEMINDEEYMSFFVFQRRHIGGRFGKRDNRIGDVEHFARWAIMTR